MSPHSRFDHLSISCWAQILQGCKVHNCPHLSAQVSPQLSYAVLLQGSRKDGSIFLVFRVSISFSGQHFCWSSVKPPIEHSEILTDFKLMLFRDHVSVFRVLCAVTFATTLPTCLLKHANHLLMQRSSKKKLKTWLKTWSSRSAWTHHELTSLSQTIICQRW